MSGPMEFDLIVLGGGAAGMAAAISAARALQGKRSVALLEHGPRVGKKLLTTGNGRCNLTNLGPLSGHYHGNEPAFIQTVLAHFPSRKTISFFESLGLLCREEGEGRVYPYCGQASAVLDSFRTELEHLGVRQLLEYHPQRIVRQKKGFQIHCTEGIPSCRRLIVATGGKSLSSTGSDGSGYRLLQELGHTATKLFPSLTQIRTDPALMRPIKGLRCEGAVSLLADDKTVRREKGEIQFTEAGLSGICIFQLSRLSGEFFTLHTVNGKPTRQIAVSLDLMPDWEPSTLTSFLVSRRDCRPYAPLEQFLAGVLNKRVGQTLLKAAGCAPLHRPSGSLTDSELSRIAALLKGWRFQPSGLSTWNAAQVTAGGISCREFSPHTMESRSIPGLYAAGEVLDVDGDCGGFNLQWAWSSGILAGQSAAASLLAPLNNQKGAERFASYR